MLVCHLWSYLLADVASTAWTKLSQGIVEADDFERISFFILEVIGMIGKYVRSIQVMYFFSVPKIQRMINELISQCRSFLIFFTQIESSELSSSNFTELETIDETFRMKSREFYLLLRDLAKSNSSMHLYHLVQRMELCV